MCLLGPRSPPIIQGKESQCLNVGLLHNQNWKLNIKQTLILMNGVDQIATWAFWHHRHPLSKVDVTGSRTYLIYWIRRKTGNGEEMKEAIQIRHHNPVLNRDEGDTNYHMYVTSWPDTRLQTMWQWPCPWPNDVNLS